MSVADQKVTLAMAAMASKKPSGVSLVQWLFGRKFSYKFYKASVLCLTFIAYSLYHLSRKPSSIVKNTFVSGQQLPLHSKAVPKMGILRPTQFGIDPINAIQVSSTMDQQRLPRSAIRGWAPFDGDSGPGLLGEIDVAFLAVYAVATFFAGHLGDRLCLRWFLTVGMIGSGVFCCLFGLAYWWNIHWLPYFFMVQMISGLFQATGWPSVVSVMTNWYGKSRRGLILGVWNAHTSFGNICGSLIASSLLDEGWGWAFLVPGMAVMAGGVLVFLFLVVDPSVVGFPSPHTHTHGDGGFADEEAGKVYEEGEYEEPEKASTPQGGPQGGASMEEQQSKREGKLMEADDPESKAVPLLVNHEAEDILCEKVNAVGFFEALSVPGVVPFALCLFFTKLITYTFIYWLPFYITDSAIGGVYVSDKKAGDLSTLFDVGGVVGGVTAGHISDRLNARATTAALFMWGAIPALAVYRAFGSTSLFVNISLLLLSGFFVNGPYSLITTAVSADLGMQEQVRGNARALATVAAIIDGTGSIGAALGPLFTGYITEAWGWNAVFAMLTLSAFISGSLLIKQVFIELKSR